ncbi:hypothetical protein [Pseudonocardia sp. D17]
MALLAAAAIVVALAWLVPLTLRTGRRLPPQPTTTAHPAPPAR